MSDKVQKEFKKRLKTLMNRPENQVCADCPERQPRWASLIVPPPGSPEGTAQIGALICLECSGSHRRLGVHISFVRSINLDSWKEKEVQAMENGGNRKVNAMFEANLPSGVKPQSGADLNSRLYFVRDKYERRRYYDPSVLSTYKEAERSPAPTSSSGAKSGSDLALARAQAKKRNTAPRDAQKASQSPIRRTPGRSRSGGQKMSAARARRLQRAGGNQSPPETPKRTVPAEPVVDLLDFSAEPETRSKSDEFNASGQWAMDFLNAGGQQQAVEDDSKSVRSAPVKSPNHLRGRSKGGSRSRSRSKSASRAKMVQEQTNEVRSVDADAQEKRKSVDNIMAMYNTAPVNQMQMNQMNMQSSRPSNFTAANNMVNNSNDKAMGGYQARLMNHQNLMMQQMQQQMRQMSLTQQMSGMQGNGMGMMNPMMQQQQMQMMNPMMQQQQMQMMNPMMQMNNMQMMGGMNAMQPGMGNPSMNPQLRASFQMAENKQMSISDLAARRAAPADKNDPFASLG